MNVAKDKAHKKSHKGKSQKKDKKKDTYNAQPPIGPGFTGIDLFARMKSEEALKEPTKIMARMTREQVAG